MIIPVIFSLSPTFDNLMYSWVFYKGISFAKNYGWPVFSQKQYFEQKDRQRQLGYLSEAYARANDYDMYSPADENRYLRVEFPEELIEEFIGRYPSQTDAYLASLSEPWPELTDFMVEKVKAIEQELGEAAEAFICLPDTLFIRDAAKVLGIDIIHYEWGPFRAGTYRNTAYFDLKGSICDGEMLDRYADFQLLQRELPILGSREILAIFLHDDYLDYATADEEIPLYEAGIALGHNIIHNFASLSQSSAIEALTAVHKSVGTERVWVRYHPGDPIHARLANVEEQQQGTLIDFIKKSKRIVCVNSNVAYEAMLFHRPVYDLGTSHYGAVGNRTLKDLPDRLPENSFLSLIAFGYLVPFELLKNVDYLRWRLGRPSEKEIYMFHLAYYLNQLGLPETIFALPEDQWLKHILSQRGRSDNISMPDQPLVWARLDEKTRLYLEANIYQKMISRLQKQNHILENEKNSLKQRCCAAESNALQFEHCFHKAENERERLSCELAKANECINTIKNSREYSIGRKYFCLRDKFFPIGSRRRKLFGFILNHLIRKPFSPK